MIKYSRKEIVENCNSDLCLSCFNLLCEEKNLISDNEIPFLKSDWISHQELGKDCCGIFSEIRESSIKGEIETDLFCNECGYSLRAEIKEATNEKNYTS